MLFYFCFSQSGNVTTWSHSNRDLAGVKCETVVGVINERLSTVLTALLVSMFKLGLLPHQVSLVLIKLGGETVL